MPLDFWGESRIPNELPIEMEAVVNLLKKTKNQEECLQIAYDTLTKKYKGSRVKTYSRFFDLFIGNLNVLWQKSGFLHCTSMNFLLRVLLVKSGYFSQEDIKTKWTLVWYVSPHQYLSFALKGGRRVNVDMWGKSYGIPFGNYARGFNSSFKALPT